MSTPENLEARLVSAVFAAMPVEIKLAPADVTTGTVAGYASTFGGKADRMGDVIQRGAFRATLAEHKAAGTMPAMLWSHDPSEVIGRWTEIREDANGLWVKGELNGDVARSREVRSLVKTGAATGLSIGFITPKGGRTYQRDGSALVTAVDLLEISIVAMPANTRARVREAKSVGCISEFREFLQEAGFPKAAAVKLAASGWASLDPETKSKEVAEVAAYFRDITKGR